MAAKIKYVVKNRSTGRILSYHIKLARARASAIKKGKNSNSIRIYMAVFNERTGHWEAGTQIA